MIAAIKQVIQKANQEEEQALASNDPTVMQDTATADYYKELVQDVQSLSSNGISAIHLSKLDWGPITSQDSSTVIATTSETWDTTLGGQGTLQQTDTNVYTLVLQDGTWKVQSDQHPDSNPPQTASGSGSSGTSGNPGETTAPADSSSASENWAGYAATGGTFTSVAGSWTVPTVTAGGSRAADATWVGIGGIESHDLIQAGTEAIVENGDVTYAAWVETLPQASKEVPLTIHPGDKVNVSLEQQSTGTWLIVIQDVTSGESYKKTVSYQSSLSSAEWIQEAPTSGGRFLMPIDDFGSITFTNATATENGQQETLAKTGAQSITMQYTRTQVLVQTSSIGSDGASFTVTRTDVPAPTTVPRGGHRFGG